MQKRLFAFMFAISMFAVLQACPAYAQDTQTIAVAIPFDFVTGNGTLPAGSYRIEPVGSSSRGIWRIESKTAQHGEFLQALTVTGNSKRSPRLTFHRHGDQHFLAAFKTPSYEVELPASEAEKTIRMPGGRKATMVTVNLEPPTTAPTSIGQTSQRSYQK